MNYRIRCRLSIVRWRTRREVAIMLVNIRRTVAVIRIDALKDSGQLS